MTSNLAKYHARMPRYILQPEDNTIVRMAGPQQTPWEEGTEIKNISLSGLAFTVPSDLCPTIGEFIKIQYSVPGSQQMACHALVTRLEPISGSKTLVGVKFFRTELSQRIILAQGLALKIREQQLQQATLDSKKLGVRIGKWGRFLPFLLFSAWVVLYYLTSTSKWLEYFSNN